MSKKAQKNGRNHKKTGKKRAILPKRPFKTGMPVLKRATSEHCCRIETFFFCQEIYFSCSGLSLVLHPGLPPLLAGEHSVLGGKYFRK